MIAVLNLVTLASIALAVTLAALGVCFLAGAVVVVGLRLTRRNA